MDQLVEKYAALPQSQRLMMAGIIVMALAALHYYMIYDDQRQEVEKLESLYEKQVTSRASSQSIAQNLSQYEGKLSELQTQLDEARAKLPDSADVPQLLAQMSNQGRQVGVEIQKFEPSAEVNKGFYSEIVFNVNVSGSYHEISMFIDALGKLDRIVNVTDLQMKSPKTVNSKVVVDGVFLVKTYRFTSAPKAEGT